MQLAQMSGSGSGWMLSTHNASMLMNITNSTSDGLTCHEAQVKGLPLPLSPTTASIMRSLQIIYYITTFLVGIVLNTFLVSIMATNKRLKNITYWYAAQIILLDLANALVIFPTSAVNAIFNSFAFTGLCSILGLVATFLPVCRSLLMGMLVVDRFCTVFMPFQYNRHQTKVVAATSLVAWVVAMIVSLIPVTGLLDCYAFQRFTWSCLLGEGCGHQAACTSFRTIVTTTIALGSLVAFLLYCILLIKARKIRNRVEASIENETADEREEIRNRRQHERRVNTTFFILFLALVGVVMVPFVFFTFGNLALNSLHFSPPPPLYTIIAIIARSCFVSLIILDPIVIMRNPEVREVIVTIKAKMKRKLKCGTSSQDPTGLNASVHVTQNTGLENDYQLQSLDYSN